MTGRERVGSFHRVETQGAKLLLSRQVLSSRLQPNNEPAIVVGEVGKLLAAGLDKAGIPVHEEFIWLNFVDSLPPGYELIKNNLQSPKKSLTRTVLEDALRSQDNVQAGVKKGRAISYTALFVSSSKAGRFVAAAEVAGQTTKK